MRGTYVGKCIECNSPMYYNEMEEKLVATSNLPNHQCSLEEEGEEDGET